MLHLEHIKAQKFKSTNFKLNKRTRKMFFEVPWILFDIKWREKYLHEMRCQNRPSNLVPKFDLHLFEKNNNHNIHFREGDSFQ